MQKLEYQKVKFVAPRTITEAEFNELKKRMNADSNFKIDEGESFLERFKINFIMIGFAVFVFFVFGDSPTTIAAILGLISVFAFFGGIFYLFAEGPSYATYLKDRKEYFDKLEYAISSSDTYSEFKAKFFPW